MTQPTFQQVRPNDPHLTNLSLGFRNPEFYWSVLAPIRPVDEPAATYDVYDDQFWFRDEPGADRGPSSRYTRVGWGVGKADYSVSEIGYEQELADPIVAASRLGTDPVVTTVQHLSNVIDLQIERRTAEALFNADGVWTTDKTLAGVTQWDDAASDPVKDIRDAKYAIMTRTGFEPNTLVVSQLVMNSLIDHPDFVERFKYAQVANLSETDVAGSLRIGGIIVAKSSYTNSAEDGSEPADSTYVEIYGKHALLLSRGVSGASVPNGAETFIWTGDGAVPWAADQYREEHIRSDVYRVYTQLGTFVISKRHGYRFKNAVS